MSWTVTEAADNLFIDRKRIYDWISRRCIYPDGIAKSGELTYNEFDLLQAERVRRVPKRWNRLLGECLVSRPGHFN